MEIVPSASGTTQYTLAALPPTLDTPPLASDSEMVNKLHGSLMPWQEHCGTCLGKGVFNTRLQDGSVVTCECNCREQWILTRRLHAANIDNTYARLGWNQATGVPPEIADQVRGYIAKLGLYSEVGIGLTLFGDRRGTGKTLLTTLVLKEAMAQGSSVFFARFYDLLRLYSQTWKDDSTEAWFARRVERSAMLGVDDIGKESAQSSASVGMVDQFLDRMLRGRIANNRVTMINSNLDPESEKVGEGFQRYQQDVLELLSEVNETIELHAVSFRTQRRERKLADARDGVRYPVVIR
jgi:DNA replication protein DnaC